MNPTQEEDHPERPPRDHWPWHFFNYLQQALAHPRRSSWASQLLLLLPKKTPQNLSSPPLPSFPFSILSSQVLRPRPGRCGARRPLRRKAEEEREGAAAQVVSTLSCASPRVICSVPPTQNINEIKFRTFYETKYFPLCLRQIQRSAAYRTFYLPLPKDFPGPGFLTSSW